MSELEETEIIGNVTFMRCFECKTLYRIPDINNHLWNHAKKKYDALPPEKKKGRFKSLRKLLSKQYPVGLVFKLGHLSKKTAKNSRENEKYGKTAFCFVIFIAKIPLF